jgi:hypothetical protein
METAPRGCADCDFDFPQKWNHSLSIVLNYLMMGLVLNSHQLVLSFQMMGQNLSCQLKDRRSAQNFSLNLPHLSLGDQC